MSLPIEVVFRPIPGSSQEIALDSRADDTLYCGARGPGKTAIQLMRFRRYVGLGYGSFWRGVIFDREFKNLADLVAQSKKLFTKFGDGAKFLSSQSDYKWVWPTGEELLFRHVKKIQDYDNFHGHEYPFQGWNELTKQPTSELFDKLISTNRSSFNPLTDTPKRKPGSNGGPEWTAEELAQNSGVVYDTPDGKPLPPIPLQRFSTCNPSGSGHNWVKKRYINVAKYGEVVKTKVKIFNPRTQTEEEYTQTQVAIFGSYKENIYLDPKYVADLNSIKDPNLKAAWLQGSWDVNAGGALDDLWATHIHVVPRFKIPKGWRLDRSFDWGSTHPYSVGWWAEANGEEVTLPDGSKWAPQRGSFIQIAELYGTDEIGTNKGQKLSAKEIALKIKAREIVLKEQGWVSEAIYPGPADNQIRDVREKDVETIEIKMAKEGIRWIESDKSAGSRKIGLQLIRDRLEASINKEGPGLYFMSNCKASIEILPYLPRDEDDMDDIDTDAEDHPYDMARYKVLKGNNRMALSIAGGLSNR